VILSGPPRDRATPTFHFLPRYNGTPSCCIVARPAVMGRAAGIVVKGIRSDAAFFGKLVRPNRYLGDMLGQLDARASRPVDNVLYPSWLPEDPRFAKPRAVISLAKQTACNKLRHNSLERCVLSPACVNKPDTEPEVKRKLIRRSQMYVSVHSTALEIALLKHLNGCAHRSSTRNCCARRNAPLQGVYWPNVGDRQC
jgi:hypothetical protein